MTPRHDRRISICVSICRGVCVRLGVCCKVEVACGNGSLAKRSLLNGEPTPNQRQNCRMGNTKRHKYYNNPLPSQLNETTSPLDLVTSNQQVCFHVQSPIGVMSHACCGFSITCKVTYTVNSVLYTHMRTVMS